MYILGISCYFHDAAAVLLKNGKLLAASEEERFSRKKHDYGFPVNAIQFCLEEAEITGNDLDYVVFYEKPFIKFERILMTAFQTFPKSCKVFREAMKSWLLNKLWIKNLIREKLKINESKILFCEHHLSHAASVFFCSSFYEAAILTVDGVGEWSTTTFGVGKKNEITLTEELRFPHSIGLLYSAFTAFLGFKVNEGEYKVMGMAPYGEPKYIDKVYKLLKINSDGSIWLDMDYFSYHYSPVKTFTSKFVGLFGEPRKPDMPFFTRDSEYPAYFNEKPLNYEELCQQNQYYADIAASIQRVTEEIVLKMVNYIYKQTGFKKLCFAGGVALNSVVNGRILKESPFDEIFIQPAAGDSGGALGAALYVWHTILGKPREFVMEHTYLGKDYTDKDIKQFLDFNSVQYIHLEDEEELLNKVIDYLLKGKVVGWFQGKFEWGPRALGNRSILADPRNPEMKDIVNTKIKFREPYRPFAPAVLIEKTEDFFDLPDAAKHYPAKFMLLVVPVKEDKKKIIPAVTHVDGTARLQTVFKDTNPRYYRLIEKFGIATGVPLLLNTSFNLKGEPIVNTPQNAYDTFVRSGLDMLVMGNYIVKK